MRNIFLHASSNTPSNNGAVNEWGQEGWEVVQVFTTIEEKSILGMTEKAGILLKRKVDETSIV